MKFLLTIKPDDDETEMRQKRQLIGKTVVADSAPITSSNFVTGTEAICESTISRSIDSSFGRNATNCRSCAEESFPYSFSTRNRRLH